MMMQKCFSIINRVEWRIELDFAAIVNHCVIKKQLLSHLCIIEKHFFRKTVSLRDIKGQEEYQYMC
jgi:hypothetical protein